MGGGNGARRVFYLDAAIEDRALAVQCACPMNQLEAQRLAIEITAALSTAPIEHRCIIGPAREVLEVYYRRVTVERPGVVFVLEVRE